MPRIISDGLSEKQLLDLRGRIRKCGLSAAEISRILDRKMCSASVAGKLRGDTPFSEEQLSDVLKVIRAAETKTQKLGKMLSA
jgi:hypothetical protein